MQPIPCKVCDTGHMERKSIYRMSGVVVLIGYILLIPSFLGMALGLFGLFTMSSDSDDELQKLRVEIGRNLISTGISSKIAEKVVFQQDLTQRELDSLNFEQKIAISKSQEEIKEYSSTDSTVKGVVGTFFIFIFIGSLVFGLLGWLLIMKKKVLMCDNCRAIVEAS